MTSAQTTTDVLPANVFSDPALLRAALGNPGPVHRVRLPDGMPAWLVTGHDEVRQVLSDHRFVRSIEAAAPELLPYLGLATSGFRLSRHMLFADPPDHTRLRRLVSQAFTARRIEGLRPRVQQIADQLLDAVAGAGRADLVPAFALPLPIIVICELLGVPVSDREAFEHHAETITGVNSTSGPQALAEAGQWFDTYVSDLVARRRAAPEDDLISAMVQAQDHDDRLTDLEICSNVFLLLAAGFETSVNLLANGLLALLRNPVLAGALRRDPALAPAAVEEMLRYDSPVSSVTYRFARERVVLGDAVIEAGEHIALSLPSANYDADRFESPGELRIDRPNGSRHLSFGHGIHFCLGAPLARIEGQVAVSTVLRRLPDLRLAVPAAELTWQPTFIVHRLETLPVVFTPGTGSGTQEGTSSC
jgi:cytochrome P450